MRRAGPTRSAADVLTNPTAVEALAAIPVLLSDAGHFLKVAAEPDPDGPGALTAGVATDLRLRLAATLRLLQCAVPLPTLELRSLHPDDRQALAGRTEHGRADHALRVAGEAVGSARALVETGTLPAQCAEAVSRALLGIEARIELAARVDDGEA